MSRLSEAPSQQILFYQVLVGFVLLMGVTLISEQTQIQWSTPLVLNLIFQTIVVGLISFVTWLWMLRRYVASQLSVFTFLTPVLGVLLGAVLLNEPLENSFIVGAVLVVSGMLLVHGHRQLGRWFTRT